jgi:hypothetical protein
LGIDAATWIKMTRQLPLTRSEQEVLRRFEEDPTGRQFLPLSDVLRNHKLIEESVELLAQGVQDHPGFAVARVVLAREMFQRGMVMDAWTVLDHAPLPLTDNVLAQKLRFKMAVLLGDEPSAITAFQHLRMQQGVDPEIKRVSERLEISGIVVARQDYRADLSRRGIDLMLPSVEITTPARSGDAPGAAPASAAPQPAPVVSRPRAKRFVLEYELDDSTRRQLESFHVVPLTEVFMPGSSAENIDVSGRGQIELDSTTLADIYAKQGFYAKALAIYRRLLRMAPHNDLIRLKVSELARLEKEQRTDDLEADPVAFDRMEVVEIIDRQTRFINGLLEKIT